MNKLGLSLGLIATAGLLAGYALLPTSCQMTPEQAQRLQAITVPVASLGLTYAQATGQITMGERITLSQGVAIVTSDKTSEVKIFELAELGLQDAVQRGLLQDGNIVELKNSGEATISAPLPTVLGPLPSAP